MCKVFKDLSGLKKSVLIRVEKPEPVTPAAVDDGRDAVDYFMRREVVTADVPVSDEEVLRSALEDLAEEKVSVEERLRACEENLSSARRRIGELEREVARLTGENAQLRGEAAKRAVEEPEPSPPSVPPPAAEVPRKGLLDRPFRFEEMFADEMREMLIASLADYRKTVENCGYQRRAAVLDAILAANGSSGELETRSAKLRQILKDAGYFNNPKPLEKLGMKLIDGRKHWKLEYAGIRITLAKTPSDHCSNANSAADIARRCF